MKRMVLVLVMRRDPDELTSQEHAAIRRCFPGCSFVFRREDPADYQEHAELCEKHKPDVVMLPKDRPVPSLAMERGFAHCVVSESGEVMKLLPITPQFVPFTTEKSEAVTDEAPAEDTGSDETRFTEIIGYVEIANDGIPSFSFDRPEEASGEVVELRVAADYARVAPLLKATLEIDPDDFATGLVADIFLAGMRYERRRRKK